MIEPLGFKLDDSQLKRAGMDYWEHVEWRRWPNWAAFDEQLPAGVNLWLVESNGPRLYTEARFGANSPAGQEAADILRGLVSRVARTGRLRTSVERAATLIGATGVGLVLTLIAMPPAERDLEIVTIARESTLRAILTDAPAPASGDDSLTSRAVALRETLGDSVPALSAAERALLTEWLDRIAATQRGRVTPAPRSGP